VALGLAVVAVAVMAAWPYARVASFVVRAAGIGGWAGRSARVLALPIEEQLVQVPTRDGVVRGRLYRPVGTPTRTALLVSGIHSTGIDEPRLIRLARDAAAAGWAILTPQLPDLMVYRVTPRSTDIIEDAALWLSGRRDLVPDGRIGLLGISFSGGLSIVAAGRPNLRAHTRFVFSVGGHGDLPRVLKYLCTGTEQPADGASPPPAPHDYGPAIVAFGVADELMPPEQVDPFREAVRTFLDAAGVAYVQPSVAEAGFRRARLLERDLAEPAATLAHYVNTRNVPALGARLLPHIDRFGTDPALSPERSAAPEAPVFLLHGMDDNVVPAVESRLLARWLNGKTSVHTFFSRPLGHATVAANAAVADYWGLIVFWRRLLAQ
jgi:dienelactone hydrolase